MSDSTQMNDPGELERFVEAAKDSVTDDMVSRLSETAAESMDLLDRVNRSGVGDAIPAIAQMVKNGDLQRLVDLSRLYGAAEDSVTDDMVGRLAETAGEGMALLDKVNRSGLDKAIPVLAELTNSGDLERVAGLARLVTAAEDSVTDDMIGRLAETVGEGMALLDQVNRAEIGSALPAISQMVANGDLQRVVDLVRLVGAAEDSITDDMVGRLAETLGEGISLVDRLNRSGVGHLVDMLERLDSNGSLERLAEVLPRLAEKLEVIDEATFCIANATEAMREEPPAKGGIGGLLKMMTNRENQEFIRFAMALGRQVTNRFRNSGE